MKKPILLVIIDGMGDRPVKSLGNQTPLEAASTSNFDILAKKGDLGLLQVIDRPKDEYTSSGSGHFILFGYPRSELPGRGVLEALGMGIKIKDGALYWRANFATFKGGLIVDRRAGRITEDTKQLCQSVSFSDNGYTFNLYPALEHRGVLEITGPDLSAKVSDNDSKEEGVPPQEIKPTDNSVEAKKTAELMTSYIRKIQPILESNIFNEPRHQQKLALANYLLVRGPSLGQKAITLQEKYGLRCAAIAAGIYRGIASHLGMTLIDVPGLTFDTKTDLESSFKAAKLALNQFDFVFLHIKAADDLGHDGLCLEKKSFLEKIDENLPFFGDLSLATVAITADHATPCEVKTHTSDPVPLLIYPSTQSSQSVKFGETSCRQGTLGIVQGQDLMKILLKRSGR